MFCWWGFFQKETFKFLKKKTQIFQIYCITIFECFTVDKLNARFSCIKGSMYFKLFIPRPRCPMKRDRCPNTRGRCHVRGGTSLPPPVAGQPASFRPLWGGVSSYGLPESQQGGRVSRWWMNRCHKCPRNYPTSLKQ